MGGYGSGFQGIKADTVEDCVVLSIAELFQKKALVSGSLRECEWAWTYGNAFRPHAAIHLDADLRDEVHATIRLRYFADGEPIDSWIFLTVTKPHFGGRRWWFKCPSTGRRAAKLFLPPGERRFASREAHGLSYRSCQKSGSIDRFCRRLARQLGRDETELHALLR
jgi:hypothetical protein